MIDWLYHHPPMAAKGEMRMKEEVVKKMSVEKATLCSGLDEDTLDLLSIVIKQERAREREDCAKAAGGVHVDEYGNGQICDAVAAIREGRK